MAADKFASGFGNDRFEFLDDAGFDAANIGDQSAMFERTSHPLGQLAHLPQRRAKYDEAGIANGFSQIGQRSINDAERFAFGDTGGPAHIANDPFGQFPLLESESKRTAQKANA